MKGRSTGEQIRKGDSYFEVNWVIDNLLSLTGELEG